MATYSVQITLNVPGVGIKQFTQAGISANTIEEAMVVAKQQLTIRVTQVVETAQ